MEKYKLYILDDNDIQRTRLQELLNNEYDIVGVSNDGLEGYEAICNAMPHLILTDIVLQNYDGFELLEKLNTNKEIIKPKIVVLSSLKGEDFAQKAIDLGASYYMVKPTADEVLIKRLKSIMQEVENFEEPKNNECVICENTAKFVEKFEQFLK